MDRQIFLWKYYLRLCKIRGNKGGLLLKMFCLFSIWNCSGILLSLPIFFKWTFSMCEVKNPFLIKFESHKWHLWGVSPSCCLEKCLANSCLDPNLCWQTAHWNALWRLWTISICLFSKKSELARKNMVYNLILRIWNLLALVQKIKYLNFFFFTCKW